MDNWFDPFNFQTSLSHRVSDLQDQSSFALTILHENTHYFQYTTTYIGIYRSLKLWEAYTKLAPQIPSDVDAKTSENLQAEAKAALDAAKTSNAALDAPFNHFTYDQELEIGPVVIDYDPEATSLTTFVKSKEITKDVFVLDHVALVESMAQAYEVWHAPDRSKMELLAKSDEPGLFAYAFGYETVRHYTGWKDPLAISQLTLIACDFALTHILFGWAFNKAILTLKDQFEFPMDRETTKSAYALLVENFLIPEVAEEIDTINAILTTFIDKSQNSKDDFDLAMASLFQLQRDSLASRRNDPGELFCQYLWDFRSKTFVEKHHMPMYRNKTSFIDTGISDERFNAVLILTVLSHRLQNLASEEDASSRCPFYHSDLCGFEKTDACKRAPWLVQQDQTADKSLVCKYRFVEHALETIK